MRGSLKIARLFNIPVFVHWSFLLVFFLPFLSVLTENGSISSVSATEFGISALYVIALFTCVVLHELGHALSARRYGVETRDIIILPIGGVARLERLPEKPLQEFVVAVMGPMVNVGIVLILALVLSLFGFRTYFSDFLGGDSREFITSDTVRFIFLLMISNFWLVGFNMVPAFPMDGGRVLRALLSLRLGRVRATFIAALLGQILSVGFIAYGLWEGQYVLAMVGFFIFTSARNEYKFVKSDEMLKRSTISSLLRTQFTTFMPIDPLGLAANEMRKGHELNFLISDEPNTIKGILQEEDILDAIKNNQLEAMVSTYSKREFAFASPFESVKEVYNRMLTTEQYILPVYDTAGQVLGVIDMATLQNFIRIQMETSKK
jgi:Zn-dependent protease